MKYEVWYRSVADGRAPEYVSLKQEYTKGDVLNANSRRDLEVRLMQEQFKSENSNNKLKRITVGDLVVEHSTPKTAYIYTHLGSWSVVKLIND